MESVHRSGKPFDFDWRSGAEIKSIALALLAKFKQDRITTLAAAVAYSTIFALPAVFILIIMVAAMVNNVTDVDVTSHLRDLIQNHAPDSTQQLLNEQVTRAIENVGGGGLSIGILVTVVIALWSGSNAISSLIEAINTAHGADETRSFGKQKLTTIGLTILLAIAINLSFALLIFGGRIGEWIADSIGAGSAFNVVWTIARLLIAIVAIDGFLSLLYHLGPNVQRPFRWITPGSAFATILWLIATAGFGIFLKFSNPGSAYGIVGSVLVLLFFLDLTAIIFILGAELDVVLEEKSGDASELTQAN